MSTMYDALKKAEAERKKTAKAKLDDSVAETKEPTNDSGGENIKILLLVIAIILFFGIAFFQFMAAKRGSSVKKPVVIQDVAQTSAGAQTAPPTPSTLLPPVKPQRAPGTYGLDGVVDAGSESMAIVNGKLLKVEGSIDHLILKKISLKEVELLNTKDNTTVVLKLN